MSKEKNRPPQAQIFKKDYIDKRTAWLKNKYNTSFDNLSKYSLSIQNLHNNIENFIGCVQVPVGVAGPLAINGNHAKGDFYIPLATTEKSLVSNYQLGMQIVTQCGGVKARILKNNMHVSPLFILSDIDDMLKLAAWVKSNFNDIKKIAEKTTAYGKLLEIEPKCTGEGLALVFKYTTKDAMGANMVNIATEEACEYIKKNSFAKKYYLRTNFSTDKKISAYNLINGYGREVFAEAIISNEALKIFNTDVSAIDRYYNSTLAVSAYAYTIGNNAHVANLIAAIFIACGQDVAHVINSGVALATCRLIEKDKLYLTISLPNLLVGTVGGGTSIETQKECLDLLDCHGRDKSDKFCEIVAASALAGELGIAISLSTGIFTHCFRKIRDKK